VDVSEIHLTIFKGVVMKLKTAILAVALAFCSGAAFAENQTITLTNNGGFWTGGFSVSHTTGAFTDSITFNPAAIGYTSASIFTLGFTQASNIDFSSAILYTSGNTTGIPLSLSSSLGGMFESGMLPPTLLAGPFRLDVSGISGQAGTYTGALNISPVPEAETYAMFGIGLGVIGFFARRRATNRISTSHRGPLTAVA